MKKPTKHPFVLIVVCVLLLMLTQTLCSFVAALVCGWKLAGQGMTLSQLDDALLLVIQEHQSIVLLVSDVLTLAVIWLMARRYGRTVADFTGLRHKASPAVLALALVAGVAISFWMTIAVNLLPWPEAWSQAYHDSYSALTTTRPVLDFLALVVLGPLVEELLFRGIIYESFCALVPAGAAVVFQGLLFGGIHGTAVWMIYAAFGGCVMGYLRKHTGSVRPCVLMHMAFNGSSYLFSWFAESFGDNSAAVLFVFLGSAFVLLLCLYGISFRSAQGENDGQ